MVIIRYLHFGGTSHLNTASPFTTAPLFMSAPGALSTRVATTLMASETGVCVVVEVVVVVLLIPRDPNAALAGMMSSLAGRRAEEEGGRGIEDERDLVATFMVLKVREKACRGTEQKT